MHAPWGDLIIKRVWKLVRIMNGKTKLAALPHSYCLTEDADSALHRGQREFRTRRRTSCSRAGRPKSSIDLFLSLDPHPRRPRGGAVRRVWRKGATKVFKYGGKSPRVPTLTELFPKIQEYDWSLILSISANPRGASKQMKQVYLKGAWVYRPFPVVELKIWYRVNSLPLLLVRFSVHIYCCTRLEISHRFHCAPKQENKNTKGT